MTFLVVAESPDVREHICLLLLTVGVKGIAAETVRQARALLESGRVFSGAIIDIDDEAGDGRALAASLAGGQASPAPTVAVVSGRPQDEAFAVPGAAGRLRKPLKPEEAIAALSEILARTSAEGKEQRRHIRVTPPADEMLRVHFRLSGIPGRLTAKIIDLSLGGLGIELIASHTAQTLPAGAYIDRMTFALRGREFHPAGTIVAAKGRFAGIRFSGLSVDDSLALARYVFERIPS